MTNKKSVSLFSALLILIFHMWIFVFNGNRVEIFIKQISYIGVDIFFLLSGYSLAAKKITSYKKFLKNRFLSVYVKFIVFALIAFLYFKWDFAFLVKVICGYNLITKGGGAFLWFLPAIMIFYLLFIPFDMLENKITKGVLAFAIWFIVAFLFTSLGLFPNLFIVINRIPIFLIGYYLYFCKLESVSKRLTVGTCLLIIGFFLAYKFAAGAKLQAFFKDSFYLAVIPLAIGLTLLVSLIEENGVITLLGSATLEMYALQMLFGFKLANKIYLATEKPMLTNLLIMLIVIVASILLHTIFSFIASLFTPPKNTNKPPDITTYSGI